MSDDLVKRLTIKAGCIEMCETIEWGSDAALMREAADRIEELEAELHSMKTSGIIEVAVRNPNVMEYIRHWEGRAEAAEAIRALAPSTPPRDGVD